MNYLDYLILAALVLYGVCKGGSFALSFIHLKDQKRQAKINEARKIMDEYVAYYEKQEISKPEKLTGAIEDTAASLRAKGFEVNDQTLKDLEAMAEKSVSNLHLKQDAVTDKGVVVADGK